MIISKQTASQRVIAFSNVLERGVDAIEGLLDSEENLSELTRARDDLKINLQVLLTNLVRTTAVIGNNQIDKLYGSLKLEERALNDALANNSSSIIDESIRFIDSIALLETIYGSLKTAASVELNVSESFNLLGFLQQFQKESNKTDLTGTLEAIGGSPMPESIRNFWTVRHNGESFSEEIASLLRYAHLIASFQNLNDPKAKIAIEEFKNSAAVHIKPNMSVLLDELSEESAKVAVDQFNTVLLTGLAMLITTLGAVFFIMFPLTRRVSLAQQELANTNVELQRAIIVSQNAERAKSEFLANMSHEIRTPMNGVLGMAEILGKTEMQPRQRKFVDVIIKSGNALLTIINDILDFSKIDAGQLTLDVIPFHLLEAVEDVATLMSARVSEKDLELIVRVDPALPEMFVGDVGRFRQILTNLMGNAVKFTEQGHVLVNITGHVDGGIGRLQVAITDTGIGIPEDKLLTVFQQFSQVDATSTRRHEGTGLGLAIASKLTNLMNGIIQVESTFGKGATFTATVEMAVHEDTRKIDKQLPTLLVGSRVLVVDDNSVNREILQEQLGSWGFDSAATESAVICQSFLEKAVSYGIAVDCLILDYHMPEVNGATLAHQLYQDPRFRDIPKILLSSVDQIDHGKMIRDGLIVAWLTKPASSKQLREAVIEAIHNARNKASRQITDLKDIAHMMQQGPSAMTVQSAAPKLEIEPSRLATPALPVPTAFEPVRPVTKSPVERALQHVALRDVTPPVSVRDAFAPHDYILVAEDNEVNQFVANQILEGLGQAHEILANGRLLVQAWKERKPKLILMDVSMPEMNGLIATQTIRDLEKALGIHTPIIGLTAHALKGDKERCLESGMDDYLTKPISAEKLEKMLRKYVSLPQQMAA